MGWADGVKPLGDLIDSYWSLQGEVGLDVWFLAHLGQSGLHLSSLSSEENSKYSESGAPTMYSVRYKTVMAVFLGRCFPNRTPPPTYDRVRCDCCREGAADMCLIKACSSVMNTTFTVRRNGCTQLHSMLNMALCSKFSSSSMSVSWTWFSWNHFRSTYLMWSHACTMAA